MKKFSKTNLNNIKSIIREKSGVNIHKTPAARPSVKRCLLAAACLACVMAMSAFACYKFNCLNGDDLALNAAYKGGGRFEITVGNLSRHELRLQDKIKVMRWSTADEVEGDPERISFDGGVIGPKSTGVVTVDISGGYDVESMKNSLGEGDWYYFVLTNNDFAFGQDWGCAFDFDAPEGEAAAVGANSRREPEYEACELIFDGWVPPASPLLVSQGFGERNGGQYSDHIIIAGGEGDPVFAVEDGTITYTGFESGCGNCVVLTLDGGVFVKYGHLKEIKVSEGDSVRAGGEIASMGRTGGATGVNLYFAVNVNGEYVDPIAK